MAQKKTRAKAPGYTNSRSYSKNRSDRLRRYRRGHRGDQSRYRRHQEHDGNKRRHRLIERELKTIRKDFQKLQQDVENITGYRKELDHAFERIAAIEKQLGLKPKHA
jgi:hypothetical protein